MAEPQPQVKPGIRLILSQRSVRTVIGVAFLMMTGLGLVFPVLPLYVRSFGVGYAATGLFISSFALVRLVFDLVAGPLIDRYGERRCGAMGFLVVAVCALITGTAPSFSVALVGWAAGGAGSATAFACLYSYLLKVVPKDQSARAFGLFYGSFNTGIIAGGAIGGFLADRAEPATPILVYAGLILIVSIVQLRYVPEPPRTVREPPLTTEDVLIEREAAPPRHTTSRISELLGLPGFVTAIMLNLAYLWIIAAVYVTLVPLYAQDALGMSTAGIGIVFAIAVGAELLVLYPAGRAADSWGRKPVLIPALAVFGASVILTGFMPTAIAYGAMMGVVGIAGGYAGVPPTAMLSDIVPEEKSGTGVGIFRFCGDLGFFFGPLIAGAAAESLGFGPAFALSAVPVALALILVLRTPETLPRLATGPSSP
jgi:MFS family permease